MGVSSRLIKQQSYPLRRSHLQIVHPVPENPNLAEKLASFFDPKSAPPSKKKETGAQSEAQIGCNFEAKVASPQKDSIQFEAILK